MAMASLTKPEAISTTTWIASRGRLGAATLRTSRIAPSLSLSRRKALGRDESNSRASCAWPMVSRRRRPSQRSACCVSRPASIRSHSSTTRTSSAFDVTSSQWKKSTGMSSTLGAYMTRSGRPSLFASPRSASRANRVFPTPARPSILIESQASWPFTYLRMVPIAFSRCSSGLNSV